MPVYFMSKIWPLILNRSIYFHTIQLAFSKLTTDLLTLTGYDNYIESKQSALSTNGTKKAPNRSPTLSI